MYDQIINKEKKIALIGLGYVGLPIALEFAKKVPVIGFDVNRERIESMKKGVDPSKELPKEAFQDCDIHFTAEPEDLRDASFYIVAVPTPVDEHNVPNLKPLLSASETVGRFLKKGDYVVYESTVYPGCTEEDCVPVLEKTSGLEFVKDFKVGFSPERINPGDKKNTLTTIVKVASGCDEESAENIVKVYEMVVQAGVHKATSIKVAEASKIIENTQRDINIAFMNELSIICSRLGINTFEVLEAAGTKWNFLKFFPGLVGGHCIGVDPYYLSFKAKELGYHAQIINAGRFINDSMGGYIAKRIVKQIAAGGHNINQSHVLIMGVTFKENVSDIRNTKVVDIIKELDSYGVSVDVMDPHASDADMQKEYNIGLIEKPEKNKYDTIVVAVNHDEYLTLDESYFLSLSKEGTVFVDVKGVYRDKIRQLGYWSL